MKDEIDLGKIILDLWEGKWKIISSTFIAFIIGFGFTLTTPQRNYHAITDIKPLNSTQAQEYYQLNSLDFFKITSENLLNLYNEQLDSKLIFLDVIKDLKIYKKSDFKTEKDFDNSIIRLASRIEILSPCSLIFPFASALSIWFSTKSGSLFLIDLKPFSKALYASSSVL